MLGRIAQSSRLRPHTFPPPVRLTTFPSQYLARGYATDRTSKVFKDFRAPKAQPKEYSLPKSALLPEWQRQSSSSSSDRPPKPPAQGQPIPQQDPAASDYLQQLFRDPPKSQRQGAPGRSASSKQSVADARQGTSENDTPSSARTPPELLVDAERQVDEPTPETEPSQPLPDLRQGIPSTLDAELRKAHGRAQASHESLNITEDPAEPVASGGGRGGDGLPRSEYISSSDRRKNQAFKYAYLVMVLGAVGYVTYLGRNWADEEEEKNHMDAPSGWGVGLFYNRVKARLTSNLSYYSDPVTTKLLPDEDKDPNLRFPFVLVLSLDDLLIHEEWTRENGWRIAKRPGLDYFLRYLSQYYEIVLFTSKPYGMAEQVVRKLDPFHMIQWPLFREATLYKDGGYIKDLSYLNRPLKKVLMLDTDPHHVKHQPENAVILPKWTGDPKDQTLVQLIPFLEYLATMGFEDSRTVLKSFEGTYIPVEFARREKLLRQKFEAQEAEKRGKRPKRNLGGLSSLFGTKPLNPEGLQSQDEAFAEGKMLWDQIRERGQKNYQQLEKRIREEGEGWLAEQAAEMKRAEEEAMKDMKSGFFGYLSFGGNKDKEQK